MTFDKDEFISVTWEIETLLGYLKGNELADDYLWRTRDDLGWNDPRPEGATAFSVELESSYEYPCPDKQYAVRPDRSVGWFTIWIDPANPVEMPDDFVKQVQQGADQAWRDGASWASGLADYAFSICNRFTEPDVTTLATTIHQMQAQVVGGSGQPGGLSLTLDHDFASIEDLVQRWHGASKHAFYQFYDHYVDILAQLAMLSGCITAGFAYATQVIAETQNGLQKFLNSIRDALRDNLDLWVIDGTTPHDPPKTPTWIADIGKVAQDAYGLLDQVPVVKDYKADVDTAVSVVDSVNKIAIDLGATPAPKPKTIKVKTADELYESLTTTLYDDYYQPYEKALGDLYTGSVAVDPKHADKLPFSSGAVVQALRTLKHDHQWGLPVGVPPPTSVYSPDSHYEP